MGKYLPLRRTDLRIQALVDVPLHRMGVEDRAVLELHAFPQCEYDALAVGGFLPAFRQFRFDREIRAVLYQCIECQIQHVALGVLDREDRIIRLGVIRKADRQRPPSRRRLRARDPGRQYSTSQAHHQVSAPDKTDWHCYLPGNHLNDLPIM
jgi:hypothetical protein